MRRNRTSGSISSHLARLTGGRRSSSRRRSAVFALESLETRRVMAYSAAFTGVSTVQWSGSDTITPLEFSIVGGFYSHNQVGGGFVDNFDFDSTIPGVQPLVASPATRNDILSVGIGNGIVIDQSSVVTPLNVSFYVSGQTGFVSTGLGDFTYTTANSRVDYLGGFGGNEIFHYNNLISTYIAIDSGPGDDSVYVLGNRGTVANQVMTLVELGEGSDTAVISGVTRDVIVEGSAGDDVIDGSGTNAASLALRGGLGNDQIKGGQFFNILDGGEGNDVVIGGAAADQFVWGSGDEFDTISGGGGWDSLYFEGDPVSSNSITARRMNGSLEVVMFGIGYVLATEIENVEISAGPNTRGVAVLDLSNTGVEVIEIDVSESTTSNVLVEGTAGDDAMTLSAPNAFSNELNVTGLGYAIDINVDSNRPEDFLIFLDGLAGDDVIKSLPGVETRTRVDMDGGEGDDFLSGNGSLSGGTGNDTLKGGDGDDILDGQFGNDVYLLSGGFDVISDSGAIFDADVYRVDGTIGADNITIAQLISNFDSVVQVEFRDGFGNVFFTSTASVTHVPVIEVHTYENSDDLFIEAILAAGGLPDFGLGVRAFLGQGNDFADATGVALDVVIPISVFGEVGNDTFVGGAGFDFFAGGQDSDTYVMNVSGTVPSSFEGGDGNDTLVVNASVINLFAQTDGTLTANIDAGDQGWLYGNDVDAVVLNGTEDSNTYNVFDLSATTVRNVRINGFGQGNSAVVAGTRENDTIRVAMANPSLEPGLLQVSGLPYVLYLGNWNSGGRSLTLQGSLGDDTFECLANQGATIRFQGNEGDDTFLVGPASAAAEFDGNEGVDTVSVRGSVGNDVIAIGEQVTGLYSVSVNQSSIASGVEAFVIEGLQGNDNIGFVTLATALNPYPIKATIFGNEGNDLVTLGGVHNGYFEVLGGSGDDSLTGPAAALSSILQGEAGNDNIRGNAANDLILGGIGTDILTGGAGDDTIEGGSGDDRIQGDTGDDLLIGDDGSDLFVWAAGDGFDNVTGGLGQDVLSFTGRQAADNLFQISSAQGPPAPGIFGPALSNSAITRLDGDGVVRTSDVEQIMAFGGQVCNRFEVGNMQQTTVSLVDLRFGPHPDSTNLAIVNGTDTNDSIVVSSPQAGQVNVNGLPALVRMFGTAKSVDTLKLVAGAGNDSIAITPGAAQEIYTLVEAGDGDDFIQGIAMAYGGAGNDTLIGTDGNDLLVGGTGDDSILGLAGDDSLIGDSIMFGDVPDDAHSCNGDFEVVDVVGSFTGGSDTIRGGVGNDTLQGNQGDDFLYGDDGIDLILGQEDADWMEGGNGDDSLYGHEGDDTIYGGAGVDVIYGLDGNDSIMGDAGNDSVFGGLGDDTIHGGDGDDDLLGDEGNDYVFGNAGSDTMRGQDGNDYLAGGTGHDFIFAGLGNDTVFGEEGDDRIQGDVGNDLVYGNAGNDTVFGNDGNDTVYGGEGLDVLWGDADNDVIHGEGGDDAINGGLGHDALFGGDGNDQIQALEGDDTAQGGSGHDLIVGGDGADVLKGEDGNDVIWGQAGNDTIWGGFGDDMLYGGENDDIMLGGTPDTANVMHKPRRKGLPNDGNDTMLGGNGFDQVDGGNGDNLLDAGADNIRETILAGSGNDIAYTHQATEVNFDRTALDGGFQHIYKQGELSEPVPPQPAAGLVSYTVPAFYYTGHIFYADGTIVEHPPLSELMKRGRIPGSKANAKIATPNPRRMAANRLAGSSAGLVNSARTRNS